MADFTRFFESGPGFLDTATYGLPPRETVDAISRALSDWSAGEAHWFHGWMGETERARQIFSRLVGVDTSQVATGPSTSVLVGLVAESLPPGSTVVAPEIEFTSNLFPYLVQRDRGVKVKLVPAEAVADSIDSATALVALSAVQSSTGAVADLRQVYAAAHSVGALVLVDATQAAGWMPLRLEGMADLLVASAYKWLLSPRGAAFMAIAPEAAGRLRPIYANWFAGTVIEESYYGPPLRLTETERRLDPSPAWFSWVGAAASLELLETIGIESIYAHNVTLARELLERLGQPLPAAPSAICSLPVDESTYPRESKLKASIRDGRLRISFHLYNTAEDVLLAEQTIGPHLTS